MKVKELIKKLKKFDQEAEVVAHDSEFDQYYFVASPKFIGKIKIGGKLFGDEEIVEKAVEI